MLYNWCKQKRVSSDFHYNPACHSNNTAGAEKSFNNPDFDEVKYRNIDVEERCILIRAMFITCCDSPGFRDESKVSWEYTANIIFFHFSEAIFFYDFAYCIHDSGPLPEIICFPIKSFSYGAIMMCIVWLNCKTNWIWYAGYHMFYTLSQTIFEYFLRQMKST